MVRSKLIFSSAVIGLFGLLASTAQAQGVADPLSPHNLSNTGPDALNSTSTQVCVYCHTPHAALTGQAVPLWNKDSNLIVEGDFQRYSTLDTVTFDATEANIGSVSMACLTCHDGVQAMDVVINAPGRGLGTGNIDGGARVMTGAINPIAVIGNDLTNDHPISMQYAAGGLTDAGVPAAGVPAAPVTAAYGDPDFKDPYAMTLNGTPVWWLDVAAGANRAGERDKTDVLLYTRNDLGGIVEPFVECGSCHDPHNYGSFVAGDSVAFLRINNDSSQICTACHDK